ncbi:MAG: sulfate adenylyltransferase [Desulfobacteraceae bacterium]|nr:sulfate adenylyltransferase [Desulfobacteraceae bacterium]
MKKRKIKSIITLGPSIRTERDIGALKKKGVSYVRVNMSHSCLDDLKYYIEMSNRVGIPFILDTEGAQIRTGYLKGNTVKVGEHEAVKLFREEIKGNDTAIHLRPGFIVNSLREGDIIHVGFDDLVLRVVDASTIEEGYVVSKAITGGMLGDNKAVVVDQRFNTIPEIPVLTDKDMEAIQIGLDTGVEHIAVSYVRNAKVLDIVRSVVGSKMSIIAKIECVSALAELDEIILKSDSLLIDRGDLSKEISITRIPFIQKMVINKAKKQNKGVYVATNLLESMTNNRKPTRAEVHDVVATILDGADGLALSAETAVGKHPLTCVNMFHNIIDHVESQLDVEEIRNDQFRYENRLETQDYLSDQGVTSLIAPHGGRLVNRYYSELPESGYLQSLPKIKLDLAKQMDVEQIAMGTFSPLEGFMGEDDLNSVLERNRLANGFVWPLPIILDVVEFDAKKCKMGNDVALVDMNDDIVAVLHLESKYRYNKEKVAQNVYGVFCDQHPGVRMVIGMQPVLLSGKITLLKMRQSATSAYELTPGQVRKIFDEKGWRKVAGFHTRNVPHRGHEFIQNKVLDDEYCDGLFIHPVVGIKKIGDFSSTHLIRTYETLIERYHLSDKVVLAAFSTHSRYAGPREAIFTALCRKNYGCSHFIVGRDHTGVKNYYDSEASQKIFDEFPDLDIEVIKISEVFYSKCHDNYYFSQDYPEKDQMNREGISGTSIREMLQKGIAPPEWLMRSEISNIILNAMKNDEKVFVRSNESHYGR